MNRDRDELSRTKRAGFESWHRRWVLSHYRNVRNCTGAQVTLTQSGVKRTVIRLTIYRRLVPRSAIRGYLPPHRRYNASQRVAWTQGNLCLYTMQRMVANLNIKLYQYSL